MKIKIRCDWCNKIYFKPPSLLKDKKHHYCNEECKNKGYSKYHSRENAVNWKGGPIYIQCDFCNKLHKISRGRFNYIKKYSKNKFCNKTCHNNWMSKHEVGKNNPAYIHGNNNFPYSVKFDDKFKDSIRKRDNYKCQLCFIPQKKHLKKYHQKLHVHHIDYDTSHIDPKRLVTLCQKCNFKANYNIDYYFAYFSYIIERVYAKS